MLRVLFSFLLLLSFASFAQTRVKPPAPKPAAKKSEPTDITKFLENSDTVDFDEIQMTNHPEPSGLAGFHFESKPYELKRKKGDDPKKPLPFENWPKQVYIDGDIDYGLITKEPGQEWDICKTSPASCLGQPDSTTTIERISGVPVMEKGEINARGEVELVQYVKVKFEGANQVGNPSGPYQSGEGWVRADQLRKEYSAPLYPKTKPLEVTVRKKSADPNCPPGEKPAVQDSAGKNNTQHGVDVAEKIDEGMKADLGKAVEALKPLIGNCPLSPSTEKKSAVWNGRNLYDLEALPLLAKFKNKMPSIPKQVGNKTEKATYEDLVAIDAMARTLYSEQSNCFAKGLQYPMAVGRTAVNRAAHVDSGKAPYFVSKKPPHSSDKSTLAKVFTSGSQFQVWASHGYNNPSDKTSLMALCPSKDRESDRNWKGKKPWPPDTAAWNQALEIATQAVLFPDQFKEKTKDIHQSFYSSGMDKFGVKKWQSDKAKVNPHSRVLQSRPGARLVETQMQRPKLVPIVDGRGLTDQKCVQVWTDPTTGI